MPTVLDGADIARAVTRIAHEILEAGGRDAAAAPPETPPGARAVQPVLVGVATRGVPLAHRIADAVAGTGVPRPPVGALDITMYRDDLDRRPTRVPSVTDVPVPVTDRTVVLVDDVLYSGRTVRAALDALRDLGRPAAVRLAVLVDRGHRRLPVRPDHVGRNLPTSLGQRVRVRLAEVDGSDGVDLEDGAAGGSAVGSAVGTDGAHGGPA